MFKNVVSNFTEKMENVKDTIEFKKQNMEMTLAVREETLEVLPEMYKEMEAVSGEKLNKFQRACGRIGLEVWTAIMLTKDVVA